MSGPLEQEKERREKHKRDIWEFIKRAHPDNADFVRMATERWGKPERIIHGFDGETLDSAGPIYQKERI